MQQIHNKPQNFTNNRPVLGVVPSEEDELITAIESGYQDNESVWQLSNEPDTRSIDKFWSGVQADLKKDPNWYSFTSD